MRIEQAAERLLDDREKRFLALVVYAVDFGATFDRLLIEGGNNVPQARDDMPSALLFELAHLSRLQFDATCHDLSDGWLSHAAPTHLRPLLEGEGSGSVVDMLVLHMSLVDRLMVDTGRGTNAFANAAYKTRASTLAMALSAVGPSLVWVMDYFDPAAAEGLKDYMRSMWAQPDMQEIGTGAWDKADTS